MNHRHVNCQNRKRLAAVALCLATLPSASAQAAPPVILEIDLENYVQWR
jgi:hypothetical protein